MNDQTEAREGDLGLLVEKRGGALKKNRARDPSHPGRGG